MEPNLESVCSNDIDNYESKTNLIINYLPQTMTSDEFKSIFQSIGETKSCKLIKNKMNNQNLGYGFVEYQDENDAMKAMKLFNGLNIESKKVKVSYARQSCDSIKGTNLYICGLNKDWKLEDVNNYFSSCGKIITSRILQNYPNGESKGVGFIRYDHKFEAELAVIKLNGTLPDECTEKITVKFANCPIIDKNNVKSNRNQPVDQLMKTNLQMNGDSVTQNHYINNFPLDLTPTQNIAWTLSVFNLPPSVDERTLCQMFGSFGLVQSVQKLSGIGLVSMISYTDALNAINCLNGIIIDNQIIQIGFVTY